MEKNTHDTERMYTHRSFLIIRKQIVSGSNIISVLKLASRFKLSIITIHT